MSTATRLSRIEGSLGPKAAVLRWLDDAHRHGSLPAYAAWLVGQPLSKAPLVSIPQLVEKGIRAAMRGQKGELVNPAINIAIGDAFFRIELVFIVNRTAEDTLRVDGPRYHALGWQLRSLSAEAERVAPGRRRPGTITAGIAAWRAEVTGLQFRLAVLEAAVRRLEVDYLGRHALLFPETAQALTDLAAAVTTLLRSADDLRSGGPRRHRSSSGDGRLTRAERDDIDKLASDLIVRLLAEVRARTADDLLDVVSAQAITATLMASELSA